MPTRLSKATEALAGPSEKEGTAELLSCLALCGSSGLTAAEREAWVKVARQTLSGIPADLLKYGCQVARKTCRFPSEIVPTVFAETTGLWEKRKLDLRDAQRAWENRNAPRIEQRNLSEEDYVTSEEARQIIAETLLGWSA